MIGLMAGIGFGLAATASAQVTNGGFETGDFTGWTQFGNTGFTGVSGNFGGVNPVGGSWQAFFGPVGSTGGISQVLGLSAGSQYTVSFWLHSFGGTPNSFSADFDGNNLMSLVDDGGFNYTQYSFNVTPSVNNPTLSFTFQQNPSYYLLDDVSVRLVPEPAGMSLLALAGLLIRRR
ncbi:MAG: hypothetical protein JNG88_09440 [Phycisphaerales bacterium]|nr:hypothetical protein [Phycisphaerales bacterium]